MSVIISTGSLGYYMLQKFDPGCMDFLLWLNSFEYAFDLTPKVPYSKVELLITFLEPSVQSILVQKVAPADVMGLSYDEVICHLQELYSTQQGEEAANKRFDIRDQFIGESVFHYMNALWKIAEKCSPSVRNNTNLINRLKRGLKDDKMKQIVNDSDNLTFSDALTIAEKLESNNNPN